MLGVERLRADRGTPVSHRGRGHLEHSVTAGIRTTDHAASGESATAAGQPGAVPMR
ncbi:MAG TPA: hypothetical protein VND96_10595 [Candidatus Micrarchaeaceae archaeon]|nr:hypothetical protein [Candidatus Micrarchaeaceae archaeon]